MTSPQFRLEQLRKHRGRASADQTIAEIISATADHAARTQKKLGELIDLWESLVPPQLAVHSGLVGLRGGILHVLVDSSPTAFELDRMLRCGLLQDLRRGFSGSLVRVKIRVGSFDPPTVGAQRSVKQND